MQKVALSKELGATTYPGRGIVIGRSKDGKKAVTAYFIMGRSANSRNRVFVEDGEGIRTQAFDPSKLEDPSLIIYAPVRVLGNKTIVTNGDQTDTIYELMDKQQTFEQALRTIRILVMPVRSLIQPVVAGLGDVEPLVFLQLYLRCIYYEMALRYNPDNILHKNRFYQIPRKS